MSQRSTVATEEEDVVVVEVEEEDGTRPRAKRSVASGCRRSGASAGAAPSPQAPGMVYLGQGTVVRWTSGLRGSLLPGPSLRRFGRTTRRSAAGKCSTRTRFVPSTRRSSWVQLMATVMTSAEKSPKIARSHLLRKCKYLLGSDRCSK